MDCSDMKQLNLFAGLGVAVREFPTSTGPVDYALFVDGTPVGIIEAKKDDAGENITAVESQSNRYVNSTFKWIKGIYRIRFVYEATGKLTRFTDYDDIKYRSRSIFTFHQPQELQRLMKRPDTIRNRMKQFPDFDTAGFRKCQITAIGNLEKSFAANKPKALIQMATGAGKTFTAITTVYRLLKHIGVNRVLFLVDTKGTTGTTGRKKLTKAALLSAPIHICDYEHQKEVVKVIDAKLSVCDKIEKTVDTALQQAEAMRKSILKQAFEGKL